MIEIKIMLDTDRIESAVIDAWQNEFRPPDRYHNSDKGGEGWKEVMRQVKLHIGSMDLSEYISMAAKAQIADITNAVVEVALRETVKQKAKEMMRDGTLLTAEKK